MLTPATPSADGLDAALSELRPGLALLDLPCCVIDKGQRYGFVNRAYLAFTGRDEGDIVGRTVDESTKIVFGDSRRKMLARALGGEEVQLDHQTESGPDRGRWVRAHYLPVRQGEEVVGAAVVIVDIQALRDVQAAVTARERQLALITDTIGFPVTYVDKNFIVRYANAQSAAWTGLKPEEMIGRPHAQLAPPEIVNRVRPLLERAFAGESVTYEREALWAGREKRRIRGHMIPDKDEEGSVRGAIIVLNDIEDDSRRREELERQAHQLRFFAENIPDAIAFFDLEYRCRFANKSFERLCGMPAPEFVGKTLPEIMGEPFAADCLVRCGKRLDHGESYACESRIGMAGPEPRWYSIRLVPHMGEDGAIVGRYFVGTDIHEIKLANERIAEQDARMLLFADNLPVAIAYLDLERRYRFVNHTFAEMQGRSREEIIGRTSGEILGESAASSLTHIVDQVLAGKTVTYEREQVLPSGERRTLRGRMVPEVGPDGSIRGTYAVLHDIQDLIEAQAAIRAREEELRFFAENIPEAIVYIDLERGCTFVNNVFLASRGFTREFALGKFPKDVYPAELMGTLQPYIDRATAGEHVSYERLLQTPDTDEGRWIRVTLTPRKDDAGRVLGYYVVSSDIHDLKVTQASIEEKEHELRRVIDSVPTPLVYVDAEEHYRYANNAFLAFAGKRSDEVVGRTPAEVLGKKNLETLAPTRRRVMAGETLAQERLLTFPDGQQRWMNVLYTPRSDRQGRIVGYYATSSDMHEQKLVEGKLRSALSILSAHVENTPLAVIERDPGLKIIRWSGSAESIFGWTADEVLGQAASGWRFVYDDDSGIEDDTFQRLVNGTDSRATILHRNYRKDGSVVWVEWHHSALRHASGSLVSILSLAQDVTSRIQAEERLQHLATHDDLTGLPNRLVLHDRLSSAMSRAQRLGHGVAVMFLDLDHFKDANDTLGHRIGDELLKMLAHRTRGLLRESDLLVRLSGDEFVAVIEDIESEGGPERVAQRILDDVKRPFQVESHEVHLSASLGYAVFPGDGGDAETLLKNADVAMYRAKEIGRDSFRAFSHALAQRRNSRLELETSLRSAIRNEEFELHYQPILDVGTGHVSQVEALLRWPQPGQGFVSPADFIPVAEEAGLMREIGRWVFDTAARQAVTWNKAGAPPLIIGVNLSAGELRDSTIVDEFASIVARTGCSPEWLTLEITETSMVRDVESAVFVLRKLRRNGFRIAIDDFGTGFSSLSHLRQMPVHVLKIDKSFIADIGNTRARSAGKGGGAIVSAVTGLARGLKLEVVAEGVEHEAQLEFLRRQGCDSFQGYLASRPLPAAKLEQWLVAHARKNAAAEFAGKACAPKASAAKPAALKKRGPRKVAVKRPLTHQK